METTIICPKCKGEKKAKNKYCSLKCANGSRSWTVEQRAMLSARTKTGIDSFYDEKLGKTVTTYLSCKVCNTLTPIEHREKQIPTLAYCSTSCANHRTHSEDTKEKIGSAQRKEPYKKECIQCSTQFITKRNKQLYCTKSCGQKAFAQSDAGKLHYVSIGQKSAQSQRLTRRSKNEILFALLCTNHFNHVDTNEAIFSGWDADVIVHDIKTAILWNGAWHYKKITASHSVSQVQNRDRLKIKAIGNFGYNVYVIKDDGKHNPAFVQKEFDKFITSIS